MCGLTRSLAVAVWLFVNVGFASAQQSAPTKTTAQKTGMSDAAYIAKALRAAPLGVAKGAGVARIDKNGNMQTLRDSNSMTFFGATMKKQTPPDKLGITYMLRGDQGASNTDPSATKKTADNHWVVTGPHIMIVGAGVKDLGLPDSADADPSKPYLMWPNTPYAHAMIPVSGGAAHAPASTAGSETKK